MSSQLTPKSARIYILLSDVDDTYYIGSTKLSLQERLERHKNTTFKTTKLYTHYNSIGWEHVSIHLLKECSLYTRQQLTVYEAKYILPLLIDHNCLNTNCSFDFRRAGFTLKDFLALDPHEINRLLILARCHSIRYLINSAYKKVKSNGILRYIPILDSHAFIPIEGLIEAYMIPHLLLQ
jgi:predicted GIY-YIG superfamily endonuclease